MSLAGFRMPAEWEEHASTWIAWPHQRDDWPGKFEPVPWVYAEVVRHLSPSERVRILVEDEKAESEARVVLSRSGVATHRVDFLRLRTDRCWTRDTLGTMVVDAEGHRALIDWKFNAWAKYDNWRNDDRIPVDQGRLVRAQPHDHQQDGGHAESGAARRDGRRGCDRARFAGEDRSVRVDHIVSRAAVIW